MSLAVGFLVRGPPSTSVITSMARSKGEERAAKEKYQAALEEKQLVLGDKCNKQGENKGLVLLVQLFLRKIGKNKKLVARGRRESKKRARNTGAGTWQRSGFPINEKKVGALNSSVQGAGDNFKRKVVSKQTVFQVQVEVGKVGKKLVWEDNTQERVRGLGEGAVEQEAGEDNKRKQDLNKFPGKNWKVWWNCGCCSVEFLRSKQGTLVVVLGIWGQITVWVAGEGDAVTLPQILQVLVALLVGVPVGLGAKTKVVAPPKSVAQQG